MMMPKQYRQGDLLFVEVPEISAGATKLDHVVIAEGEATGHTHLADPGTAALFEDGNVRFLQVFQETFITHQEHNTIKLPHGIYRVVRQREYVPPVAAEMRKRREFTRYVRD